MSDVTYNGFATQLTIALELPVSRVDVVSLGTEEFVQATVMEHIPIILPAWNLEVDLKGILLKYCTYLRHDCFTLRERLELTQKTLAFADLMAGAGAILPARETFALEIFRIDDEAVTLRLGRLRQNVRDLLS